MMEPNEPVDLILNFKIDLLRIQVPTTAEYPTGEGVCIIIEHQNNIIGQKPVRHYLLPPDAAKAIAAGLDECADEAKGTGLIIPRS